MPLLSLILLLLVAGAVAYCALVLYAVHDYLSRPASPAHTFPPFSILRPLSGIDPGLEENLRSLFEQDYPEFELLFAVHEADDPAAGVVRRLQARYPHVPSRLLITGEPPYPNAKVHNLHHLLQAARYDLLVMSDSDVRVPSTMLRTLAAEFQDPKLGLTTCPYRGVSDGTIWSRMEALGMNTEFLGGVLVARVIEGMRFAVGPTVAARRQAIESIGGIETTGDYLAEDFMLGRLIAERGWKVDLSRCVVEHHIGSRTLRDNLSHRLRWMRSSRRSRPAGYLGMVFTYPISLGLLLLLVRLEWWPAFVMALGLRGLAAWATGWLILRDPALKARWYLLPLQGVLSFLTWLAGFFGDVVVWRGRRYRLLPNGRIVPLG